LYHIDAYRLEGLHQDLGFEELMEDEGITVIEWPDYMSDQLPSEYLRIDIKRKGEFARKFTFIAQGEKYQDLLEGLNL